MKELPKDRICELASRCRNSGCYHYSPHNAFGLDCLNSTPCKSSKGGNEGMLCKCIPVDEAKKDVPYGKLMSLIGKF